MTWPEADGVHDAVDAALRELTDEERAFAAAVARRRERDLREQAAEEGSLAGALLDLAEREQPLAVSTRTGRTLRGVARTIGTDFVGLRGPNGAGALIALGGITAIRTEPGAAPTLGDRAVRVDTSLRGALHDLATARPWITFHTAGGEGVAGELRSVGRDLVLLRSATGVTTYVTLAGVGDVVLP